MAPSNPDGEAGKSVASEQTGDFDVANTEEAPKKKKKSKIVGKEGSEQKLRDDDEDSSEQKIGESGPKPQGKKKVKKAGLSKSGDGGLANSGEQPEANGTLGRKNENKGLDNEKQVKRQQANDPVSQGQVSGGKEVPQTAKALPIGGSLEKQSKRRKKVKDNKTELEPEVDGEVAEDKNIKADAEREKGIEKMRSGDLKRWKSKKKANETNSNLEPEAEGTTAQPMADMSKTGKEVEEQTDGLPMNPELHHSKDRKKSSKEPETKADKQELLGRTEVQTSKDRKKRKKNADSEVHLESDFLKPENAEPKREATTLDELKPRTRKKTKKKSDANEKETDNGGNTDAQPKDSVIESEKKANEKIEPEAEGTVAGGKEPVAEMPKTGKGVEKQEEKLPINTEVQHSKDRKKKKKEAEKKADVQELQGRPEVQTSKHSKKRRKNANSVVHLESDFLKPENEEPEREATTLDELKPRTKKKTKKKRDADEKDAVDSGNTDEQPKEDSVIESEKKANEKVEPEADGGKEPVADMPKTGKGVEEQSEELPMNTELQHSKDRKKKNKESETKAEKQELLGSSEDQTSKHKKKRKKNANSELHPEPDFLKPEDTEPEREATNLDELKPRTKKKAKKKSDADEKEANDNGNTDEQPKENTMIGPDVEEKGVTKSKLTDTVEVPNVEHEQSKREKKSVLMEKNGSTPKPEAFAPKKTPVKVFQRVDPSKVEFLDPRLEDNSYWAKGGAESGWGAKAQEVLGRVKGRGFRHEKTKKKRGSYRGGVIDGGSHSIKFDDEDD